MASPVVTGAAALFVEQYRLSHGRDPSPALIRARLTASARDLVGNFDADGEALSHRPNRQQGWGRLDLVPLIEPDLPVFMLDQTRILSATGQAWTGRFAPVDPDAPMQVMLAWTDAPGLGLGGEMPAWVNDLDLIVHVNDDWYFGNDFGPDGYSAANGPADLRNNLEGVVLGAHQHQGGSVRIKVLAANLGGASPLTNSDAEWDFQGEQSGQDGRYESFHPDVFVLPDGPIADEGFWQFEFSNDFSGGTTMRWSDVEITLIKMSRLSITTETSVAGVCDMHQPKNPFHPGEILLEEFLQPAGITQTLFAKRIGWTRARLNELIKGKRGITADAALDLAQALGTSAKVWMNLQATYDLDQAIKRRRKAA